MKDANGENPFPEPVGPIYPHYYLITILNPPPGNDSYVVRGLDFQSQLTETVIHIPIIFMC